MLGLDVTSLPRALCLVVMVSLLLQQLVLFELVSMARPSSQALQLRTPMTDLHDTPSELGLKPVSPSLEQGSLQDISRTLRWYAECDIDEARGVSLSSSQ